MNEESSSDELAMAARPTAQVVPATPKRRPLSTFAKKLQQASGAKNAETTLPTKQAAPTAPPKGYLERALVLLKKAEQEAAGAPRQHIAALRAGAEEVASGKTPTMLLLHQEVHQLADRLRGLATVPMNIEAIQQNIKAIPDQIQTVREEIQSIPQKLGEPKQTDGQLAQQPNRPTQQPQQLVQRASQPIRQSASQPTCQLVGQQNSQGPWQTVQRKGKVLSFAQVAAAADPSQKDISVREKKKLLSSRRLILITKEECHPKPYGNQGLHQPSLPRKAQKQGRAGSSIDHDLV